MLKDTDIDYNCSWQINFNIGIIHIICGFVHEKKLNFVLDSVMLNRHTCWLVFQLFTLCLSTTIFLTVQNKFPLSFVSISCNGVISCDGLYSAMLYTCTLSRVSNLRKGPYLVEKKSVCNMDFECTNYLYPPNLVVGTIFNHSSYRLAILQTDFFRAPRSVAHRLDYLINFLIMICTSTSIERFTFWR